MLWRRRAWMAVFLATTLVGGCRGPGAAYYERERLEAPSMQFDRDSGVSFIRYKTEAAREGSFGGFGAAAAGGCACQ